MTDSAELTLLNKWLMHIKDVYRMHRDEIDALNSQAERANRLVELNVIEQVMRLSQLSIVQTAWKNDRRPMLHGWVFGSTTGSCISSSRSRPAARSTSFISKRAARTCNRPRGIKPPIRRIQAC